MPTHQRLKPQALLFDLDGTLVDSVPDIASALDLALAGLGLPAAGLDHCRQWVGGGVEKLIERALRVLAPEQPVDRAQLLQRFLAHYAVTNGQASLPYPAARETLARLRDAHLPLACVTNKPERFASALLQQLSLHEFFDCLIGGDTLAKKKPDAAPLLRACQQLNASPSKSLLVGDSSADQRAAKAAAMPFVWVSHGYHRGETAETLQPWQAIDTLSDLHRVLDY